MPDIASAIRQRLDTLAAERVPAREKPSAHDLGLLRTALVEIEQKQSRIDRLEGEKSYVVRILTDLKDGMDSTIIKLMLARLSPETTKDTP